ncbi:MAG: hypothetical protein K940chlam7_00206 [Chlamydiae bacterium]|nr:hypothetical protein [Chlamydiota bacterium]
MKNSIYIILLSSIAITLSSCATIMHGTTQTVGIASNPTSANVWVDRRFVGNTPTIVEMSRKDNHVVRIELEGYQPYEATFTRQMSGWVFGNLAFGGVIGLAVDAVSGGIYVLTPDHIQAEMQNQNLACSKKSKGSFIVVVLEPNPSWKKIGNLIAAK